jgi:phenylacetic acid degradation operon negative regulatory protein
VTPTAKSLILDLLSTLRRGTMPVSALVEAGGMFGIAENGTRVALSRLVASGKVERDERGRYRLGAGSQPIAAHVTSWRNLEQRTRRWGGGWVAVFQGAQVLRPGSRARRRRERARRLLGFRLLFAGLHVRPDNLQGGAEELRRQLGALGTPPGDLVCELRGLDAAVQARARCLWDGLAIRRAHAGLLGELERSAERLPRLRAQEARVESFLLGGRVIRQLALDPLLPEAIAPGRERGTLIRAMRRYDRLGRAAWTGFLAEFDVPHRGAPADTRMGAGVDRLAS